MIALKIEQLETKLDLGDKVDNMQEWVGNVSREKEILRIKTIC